MGLLQDILDRLTGEKERQRQAEIAQERARADAQDRADAKLLADKEQEAKRFALVEDEKKREAIQERERTPAARLLERERLREPEPKPEPVKEMVAERMQLSRERQAAPSMPGMGTVFVNNRVRQPEVDRTIQMPEPVKEPERKPEGVTERLIREHRERQIAAGIDPDKPRESILDMIERQGREKRQAEAERVAKLSPEERQAEKVLQQLEREKRGRLEREYDRGRTLELER